ncbi:MAG: cell division protein FtsL [Litoreibacter sp.]|uniref:cell division protein FtsL n=1 Tax=Litoreibacter sp. TaxID=1969459 RepID=UPI00329A19F3
MRGLFYTVSALAVMGLGYWAYYENYETQDALRTASALQSEIGSSRETMSVLAAEWAYLNRPERLRDLADLNFPDLELLPITPDQFGDVAQVTFKGPEVEFDPNDLNGAVDVRGNYLAEDGEQYP